MPMDLHAKLDWRSPDLERIDHSFWLPASISLAQMYSLNQASRSKHRRTRLSPVLAEQYAGHPARTDR
jgi:hypothetical protein